ncbi:DoxX-like family protein [Leptospira ryugenii]|uniref:DoxX-like family protein n=1 Tax=Leptospira ryugenii TaxID=1917863 RepID=A0A2P2E2U8_9LEPT|nr:DoxX family protein [Leptospira ryugenii]GBF51233.1 DoxX-like family protein [Leptospira ryugenii]
MKNLKFYYWITTGLVLFFLLPGSVMNILQTEDWLEVFKQLGYPSYLLPFLGIAKILGCIVILMPNLKRLKEWAYAGLVYDIVGAIYSALMAGHFDPRVLFMILPLSAIFASYFLWQKN